MKFSRGLIAFVAAMGFIFMAMLFIGCENNTPFVGSGLENFEADILSQEKLVEISQYDAPFGNTHCGYAYFSAKVVYHPKMIHDWLLKEGVSKDEIKNRGLVINYIWRDDSANLVESTFSRHDVDWLVIPISDWKAESAIIEVPLYNEPFNYKSWNNDIEWETNVKLTEISLNDQGFYKDSGPSCAGTTFCSAYKLMEANRK